MDALQIAQHEGIDQASTGCDSLRHIKNQTNFLINDRADITIIPATAPLRTCSQAEKVKACDIINGMCLLVLLFSLTLAF